MNNKIKISQLQLETNLKEDALIPIVQDNKTKAIKSRDLLKDYKDLNKKINSVNEQLDNKANQSDLEVERKRIDSFTKLAEGSTTADAELIDGRIGEDGIVYPNIGSAIREQVGKINELFVPLNINKFDGVVNLIGGNIEDEVITSQLTDYSSLYVNSSINNVWGNQSLNTGGYYLSFKYKLISGTPHNSKLANTLKIVYFDTNNTVKSINGTFISNEQPTSETKVFQASFELTENANAFGFYMQVRTGGTMTIEITDIMVSNDSNLEYYSSDVKMINDKKVSLKDNSEILEIKTDIVDNTNRINNIESDINNIKSTKVNVAIVGDSFSTLKNYIKKGNVSYYPMSGNDVNVIQDTWWYKVIKAINGNLLINDSFSGSSVSNTKSVADAQYSFINRIKLTLGADNVSNVKPDVIFILGGTNDSTAPIGDYIYSDWTENDLLSFAPAFAYMIDYLQTWNPFTKIYVITQAYLPTERKTVINNVCNHYGIDNIVTASYSAIGGHPTKDGMTTIANSVINYINS